MSEKNSCQAVIIAQPLNRLIPAVALDAGDASDGAANLTPLVGLARLAKLAKRAANSQIARGKGIRAALAGAKRETDSRKTHSAVARSG